jgi:hypothetical protein
MAALLSATAEKIYFAWDLNMNSLFRFEFGESRKDQKIFGHRVLLFWTYNPKENTPHNTPSWSRLRYGISKQAGEDGASTTISLASMCEA